MLKSSSWSPSLLSLTVTMLFQLRQTSASLWLNDFLRGITILGIIICSGTFFYYCVTKDFHMFAASPFLAMYVYIHVCMHLYMYLYSISPKSVTGLFMFMRMAFVKT